MPSHPPNQRRSLPMRSCKCVFTRPRPPSRHQAVVPGARCSHVRSPARLRNSSTARVRAIWEQRRRHAAQRGSRTEFKSCYRAGRSAALEASGPLDGGRYLTGQLVDASFNIENSLPIDPAEEAIPGARQPRRRLAQGGANCSVALLRRGVCDGTATGRITVRFAPRAAASSHAARSAVRGPPTVKLSTSLMIAMESACCVRIGSMTGRRKPG